MRPMGNTKKSFGSAIFYCGVDFFIGLPLKENYRVARVIFNLTPFHWRFLGSLFNQEHRQENWHAFTHDIFMRIIINAGDIGEFYRLNDPFVRTLELSSVSGIGTASALAKVFGILAVGGTDPATNRTLLSRKLVDDFMDADPPSRDLVLGIPTSFRRGMMVDELVDDVMMFGHVGAGGSLAYADPVKEVGVAFISSYQMPVLAAKDERSLVLLRTLYECLEHKTSTKK